MGRPGTGVTGSSSRCRSSCSRPCWFRPGRRVPRRGTPAGAAGAAGRWCRSGPDDVAGPGLRRRLPRVVLRPSPRCAAKVSSLMGRLQVEYPTPLASIGAYVVPEQQQALLGSYERAMFADLGRAARSGPARRGGCAVGCRGGVRHPAGGLRAGRRAGLHCPPRAWLAAFTRCPLMFRWGCTCATGITATSISSSHSHLALQVRVLDALLWRPGGRLALSPSPCRSTSARSPTSRRDRIYRRSGYRAQFCARAVPPGRSGTGHHR